ncbi:MAG TPA: DUF1501 domain-containing protein [Planctomycetaceae bacterium]|nr:DUF1501 domain-containing protein [Planctomycetaceae bacterium]HRF00157.1 DUF1501 domain-containing protein [Pirellulaceae bacterium]
MNNLPQSNALSLDRRRMLLTAGTGFGALALCDLIGSRLSADESSERPTGPTHVPTADAVIFVFLEGGPSHLDTFDPKPKLNELAGQPLPESFGPVITPMGEYRAPLLASRRKWTRYGQSGLTVSDWLPEIGRCADRLAVIRSCWGNGLNHSNGVCQMNTGAIVAGRPSLGSWVKYGLGDASSDLPAFVVMEDEPGKVINGPRNWSAGFMPSSHQGVSFRAGEEPIGNLTSPEGVDARRQHAKLDWIRRLDAEHRRSTPHSPMERPPSEDDLEARIRSYELAFRMQVSAPEAVDLASETAETQTLYGMDRPETASFGRQCLLARRLVERGVRFVQLYHGAGSRWDAHAAIEKNHTTNCLASDRPVAGLLQDLERRGLLDRTLVVWGGEFGRTPMSEKGDGRDHNPYGFTMWMAGGGVRGGQVIGATDELGLHAIEQRLHVLDLQATILHALGIDPMRLTYLHGGRPERPTINQGRPFLPLFA